MPRFTTSMPRMYSTESEVHTPAAADMEASSGGSVLVPASVCEVVMLCPRETIGASTPVSSGTAHSENVPASDVDPLWDRTPLFVIMKPDHFFATYDELSFDSNFDTDILMLVRCVKSDPAKCQQEDCRALTLFLTVTSDLSLFNAMAPLVEGNLISGKYVLVWEDFKSILINLGLTEGFFELDNAGYYGTDPPESPKIWNLKFLFMVVSYSFPSYSQSRLMRLVSFLCGCLFDPILQQCDIDVVLLLRRVVKHALLNGAIPDELVLPVNRSHYSWICNRVIIQHLAVDPDLRPLARTLAYYTIHGILGVNYSLRSNMLSYVADLMADVQGIRGKTTARDVYQLICVCENLVSMAATPFNGETKTFLEKVVEFAEQMSRNCTFFENLFFTETVYRLQNHTTLNHFYA